MARTTLQIVTVLAFAALVATVGLTVKATADGTGGSGGATGFIHGMHRVGQNLHGGGHDAHGAHDGMADLLEQLELTPEQQGRVGRLLGMMHSFHEGDRETMLALHNRLVEQFESGRLDATELHAAVDDHVERMRQIGYEASNEMVSLVNGLDDRQRGILLEHLTGGDRDHTSGN